MALDTMNQPETKCSLLERLDPRRGVVDGEMISRVASPKRLLIAAVDHTVGLRVRISNLCQMMQ